MRQNRFLEAFDREGEDVIAHFGAARLVRSLDGRLEIQGGTSADREAAQRWVRRFSIRHQGVQGVKGMTSD